jgi:hypothetical protein
MREIDFSSAIDHCPVESGASPLFSLQNAGDAAQPQLRRRKEWWESYKEIIRK